MQIECPYCHARAQLSDSKEGAKVRCGPCGKVYVARPVGRRGGSGSNSAVLFAVIAGVVALIALVIVSRSGNDGPPAQVPSADPVAEGQALTAEDHSGWRSPPVRAAVAIHRAVFERDDQQLKAAFDRERLWQTWSAGREDTEGTDPPVEPADAGSMTPTQVFELVLERLLDGEDQELVGQWKPYDGDVVESRGGEAVVHLYLSSREDPADPSNRTVAWYLVEQGGDWKAYAWERIYGPGEVDPNAVVEAPSSQPGIEGVEVIVRGDREIYERAPEPLEHLDDTPAELRQRIDTLYATMIDLDTGREGNRAQDGLVEIGKPAIPILLTGIYEIPLQTMDQTTQVNMIVQGLRRITGMHFGWQPQIAEGSGTGTTAELRESAIKQWFAWWYRYKDVFTEKVQGTDELEKLIELSEKEKDWLEKHKND